MCASGDVRELQRQLAASSSLSQIPAATARTSSLPPVSVLDPASTITVDSSRTRRTHLLARGLYELTRVSRLRRRRMRAVRRVLHVSPALFGSDGIIGGGERAAYGLA